MIQFLIKGDLNKILSIDLVAAKHIQVSDLFYSNLSGKNLKGEIPPELNDMDELAEL